MRLVLALALVLAGAAPVLARGVTVLVGTEVSDAAQASMPPSLWERLVVQWVGENPIPFKGTPTADDCTRARAAYMVSAPFELKPRLPGTALHVNDRIVAQTHVTVTNCLTHRTILDQVISIESNTIASSQGPAAPNGAALWEFTVHAVLRTHPIVFERPARVSRVSGSFVTIDVDTRGLAVGQTLRVVTGPGGIARTQPIIVTIVDIRRGQVQARYDASNTSGRIAPGDLVEPFTAAAPID